LCMRKTREGRDPRPTFPRNRTFARLKSEQRFLGVSAASEPCAPGSLKVAHIH
jgi:hypothetical protein